MTTRQRKNSAPALRGAREARQLIDLLPFDGPDDIDIELIAAHDGLGFSFADLSSEEGHLIRSGDYGMVTINNSARDYWKWRFVAAHEVGHRRLHSAVDQFELCTDADLHSWYQGSTEEREANAFAAELLMPTKWFESRCDVRDPSLHVVYSLADEFRVSRTAAALRFVRFVPEQCALAYIVEGRIAWWAATNDFPFFLKKGRPVPETYAGDLLSGSSVEDRMQDLDGAYWSDDSRAEGLEVLEHSTLFPRLKHVLSLLWCPA